MPRGYKHGDGAAKPHQFTVFQSKDGRVGVRIGRQKPYASVAECSITGVGYLLVTTSPHGMVVQGEGVVRQKDGVVIITA